MIHLQKFLFFLIILFIPSQLGLHFWPPFAFVLGARVDYLSPTIYFTDILIGLLFFSWLVRFFQNPQQVLGIKYKDKSFFILLFFIAIVIIGIIQSHSPFAGFYGLVKLFEFLFLGFFIAKSSVSYKTIIFLLIPGFILESLLALLQYANQASLNGLWYFLGERAFNKFTPGVANADISGELVLRSYGTFPHPNVLAGYLVIVLCFLIFYIFSKQLKRNWSTFLKISLLVFGTIALCTTLSRISILLWVAIVVWVLLLRSFGRIVIILGLICVGLVTISSQIQNVVTRFLQTNLHEEAFLERQDLINAAFMMIKDHLLWGVGINNFLVVLPQYFTAQKFTQFQPVHTIYLLVLSQVGIIGAAFFAWFLFRTIAHMKKNHLFPNHLFLKTIKPQYGISVAFVVLLLLSLVDHYFVTLQQGQLLFCVIVGLCWRKSFTNRYI